MEVLRGRVGPRRKNPHHTLCATSCASTRRENAPPAHRSLVRRYPRSDGTARPDGGERERRAPRPGLHARGGPVCRPIWRGTKTVLNDLQDLPYAATTGARLAKAACSTPRHTYRTKREASSVCTKGAPHAESICRPLGRRPYGRLIEPPCRRPHPPLTYTRGHSNALRSSSLRVGGGRV